MACLALLISNTSAAASSDANPSKRLEPPGSSISAPMVKYESAFTDYQPFREPQIKSWKEVNKEVADNPSMGHNMGAMGMSASKPGMDDPGRPRITRAPASHDMSAMKTVPGKTMTGMGMPTGAQKGQEGASGHDMGATKEAQRKTMPDVEKQSAHAPKSEGAPTTHDMGAMKGSNETMAMAHAESKSRQSVGAAGAGISAIGVVQGIDKNNARIKLTHEPVAALGWPKMTMFFRLKDASLMDQLNEGDKIEFALEKSPSGFVISTLHKVPARTELR